MSDRLPPPPSSAALDAHAARHPGSFTAWLWAGYDPDAKPAGDPLLNAAAYAARLGVDLADGTDTGDHIALVASHSWLHHSVRRLLEVLEQRGDVR